jgi:hypothetical protein
MAHDPVLILLMLEAHGTAALLDRIGQLEQRVAHLEQALSRRRLPAVDDWTLLRALTIALGDRVFSSADLVAFARVDDPLRAVLGTADERRVGRRLARLCDHVLHGFVLVRVKRSCAGHVWSVRQHTHAGPSV